MTITFFGGSLASQALLQMYGNIGTQARVTTVTTPQAGMWSGGGGGGGGGLPIYQFQPDSEVDVLRKENEKLREALAFYADKNNWLGSTFMPCQSFHSKLDDHASDKAKETLK